MLGRGILSVAVFLPRVLSMRLISLESKEETIFSLSFERMKKKKKFLEKEGGGRVFRRESVMVQEFWEREDELLAGEVDREVYTAIARDLQVFVGGETSTSTPGKNDPGQPGQLNQCNLV